MSDKVPVIFFKEGRYDWSLALVWHGNTVYSCAVVMTRPPDGQIVNDVYPSPHVNWEVVAEDVDLDEWCFVHDYWLMTPEYHDNDDDRMRSVNFDEKMVDRARKIFKQSKEENLND